MKTAKIKDLFEIDRSSKIRAKEGILMVAILFIPLAKASSLYIPTSIIQEGLLSVQEEILIYILPMVHSVFLLIVVC